MAVVTLKDLMDPLKKIQAATESTASALDAMSIAVNAQSQGNPSLLIKLDELIKEVAKSKSGAASSGNSSLLKKLDELIKVVGKSKSGAASSGKDGKSAKEGAMALTALGAGAKTLAIGLILFKFVPKSAISKFKTAVFDLYELMQHFKPADVKKGAESFKILSDSIGKFAKGLVLAAILLPIGMLGVKLLDVVLGMLTPVFEKIGKKSKNINKGSKALELMGTSMLSFAKGLALAGLVAIVGLIAIPFLILSIVLIGGVMALLGSLSKPITKGAKALDKVGDALKSFAIGLALFAITTFFILMQPTILLGMVASLILIGGAVAILGVFSKQIRKGSVALLLMGIGLAVFGIGYAIFAFAVAKTAPTLEAIAIQAGILIGIGIATALLGMVWSHILKGAIALALMGIGLLVFGLGYIPFSYATKDTTLEDIGIQGALLLMLGLEFAAAGVGSLFIGAGALAFAAVGGALWALSEGLIAFKKVKFTEEDSSDLATVLAAVKLAFMGGEAGGGLFSKLKGAIGGAIDAGGMTAAAVGFAAAGVALNKLSAGLKAFKTVEWTDSQSLTLANALTGISGAFASAGGEAATPTGMFGMVFGNAFSPNATKKGIDSVMGAGKALTSIATGLIAFQGLVEKDIDFVVLGEAIGKTVGFVQRAFALIGEGGATVESGGFFSSLLGIKSTAVEEGIRSVNGAGGALTDIAKGLLSFQALVEKDIDFVVLGDKIGLTVGFVMDAFSSIGNSKKVDSGGFFSALLGIKSTAVEEGIRSVKGAGDELTKIATALSGFDGLKDPKASAKKVGEVLTLVGSAFSAVATQNKEGGIIWDQSNIEDGIKAVDGAGQALTDIATGLKAFSGDFDSVAVATSVGTLLTSIGTAFSNLYKTNPTISPQLQDFSTFIVTLGKVAEKGLLDKAADGISKIADSINSIDIEKTVAFGDLFKHSSALSDDKSAYTALAKAVEDIRDMMSGEGGGGGLVDKVKDAFSGSSSAAPPADAPGAKGATAAPAADSSKQLITTLASLSKAITNLPMSIATLELKVSNSR